MVHFPSFSLVLVDNNNSNYSLFYCILKIKDRCRIKPELIYAHKRIIVEPGDE